MEIDGFDTTCEAIRGLTGAQHYTQPYTPASYLQRIDTGIPVKSGVRMSDATVIEFDIREKRP